MSAAEAIEKRGPLGFLPGLEGLRGVAVLVILVFHSGVGWLPGGFLGVSTFFTLSGFLITRLLVAEVASSGRVDFAAFYTRRARRILPAAFLALAGIAVFGAFAADPVQLGRLREDGLSALFYVANWWFIVSGAEYAVQLGSPSPIQHFWSLAIEEQFYLFFPCLVFLALRRGASTRRLVFALVARIALCWTWTAWLASHDASITRLYYGSDTRAPELFAGALLALLLPRPSEPLKGLNPAAVAALGVVGLGVSAVFWLSASHYDDFLYPGGLAIYTLASVAMLVASTAPTGPIFWLLSTAPLRWLGRISYGAYLYHWPIFLWIDSHSTGLEMPALIAVRVGLTLLLSELSYRWLEEPLRRGRSLFGGRLVAAVAVGVLAVSATLVAVTRDVEPVLALRPSAPVPLAASTGQGVKRVVLFGDSVAKNVGQALERWSKGSTEIQFDTYSMRGCGLAKGGYVRTFKSGHCDRWADSWSDWLGDRRLDAVVVLTSGWDVRDRKFQSWTQERSIGDPVFDEWLRSEYEAATDLFLTQASQVVFLTSPCILYRRTGTREGIFDPQRTSRFNETILQPLGRDRGERVEIVELYERVCRDGEVLDTLGGVADSRPDGIHFSTAAADWVASWLGPEIAEILGVKLMSPSLSRRSAP